MQVQRYVDDSWVGTCNNQFLGAHNEQSNQWGLTAPNCDHIQSWMK